MEIEYGLFVTVTWRNPKNLFGYETQGRPGSMYDKEDGLVRRKEYKGEGGKWIDKGWAENTELNL